MPTVLITGATGFIGQTLCLKMLNEGWAVKGTFRKDSGKDGFPTDVQAVALDLTGGYPCDKADLAGVDVIIHLAARVHILNDRSQNPLNEFRKINVEGTKRLASLAAETGVKRFIFISSVKVNGEGSLRPYRETDIPRPEDAYGISKMEAEDALKEIGTRNGLETVILRLPLVYGPQVKANFKNLIRLACLGAPLPLKNIRNKRSFLYLGNLCDAINTCATHPKAAGETFLVSDGQDISTPDMLRLIAAAKNKNLALFDFPQTILKTIGFLTGQKEALSKLTGSLCVDISKIKNLLGWKPPFTLEEGIAETVKNNETNF